MKDWIHNRHHHILFFNRASKGNSGVAGAGGRGVIFDPKGNQETPFAWGIGETTNNQVETFYIQKEIMIMKKAIVDLMIIICHMVHITLSKEPHMNRLLCCIPKIIEGFESVNFYHSLRGLNSLANSMDNKACNLALGILCKIYGGEVFSNLHQVYYPLLHF